MRTKTYVAFDGDTDLMSYRTVQSWDADDSAFSLNDAHEINYARDDSLPESIINQLRERLQYSKNLALLIGSKTKGNRKGILSYEINYAIRNGLPIFLFFKSLDASTKNTVTLWRNTLKNKIPSVVLNNENARCLVCPFTKNAFSTAVKRYSNNKMPSNKFVWHWK